MGVTSGLDRRSVLIGAALALAVTLPPVILVRILFGDDLRGEESNAWVLTPVALIAGFALGGYRAARDRPRTAFAHAAAAGGLAFAAIAVYSLIRHAVDGELGLTFLVRTALLGSISVSLAVLGGYAAVRRANAR